MYAGVASVMRPRPLFSTWLPYRYCISAVGFTHTCARARARVARSRAAGRHGMLQGGAARPGDLVGPAGRPQLEKRVVSTHTLEIED